MNEKTQEKTQPQSRVWRVYGVFDTYEKATQARDRAKKDKPRATKIHKLARGFAVKVWDGHYVATPGAGQ